MPPNCWATSTRGPLAKRSWACSAAKISGLQPQIDRLFAGETVEEIFNTLFADKSDDAQKWAKAMSAKSPTSLKVALEQLRRGASMSLDEVLTMEFRLSQAFCADHDFFEGIRALEAL